MFILCYKKHTLYAIYYADFSHLYYEQFVNSLIF